MKALFRGTSPDQVSCSTSTLSRFTKQLHTLLGAGIPMHEAFESLMRVQGDSLSLWVTPELHKRVTQGHRLSTCMAQFPRVFPDTYVALVRASEETGKLVLVLDRLTDWLDRRENIERHVKKAMIYPVFVIIVAFVLTMALFQTVIPGILETVIGLGIDLPWPTQVLMAIVALIEQPVTWFLLFAAIIAFIMYARSPSGWQTLLILSSHSPVFGPILTFSSSARYSHTMALLLDSGVDIMRAVRIAADASGHPLFKHDSKRIIKELREGAYFSDSLNNTTLYPSLLPDMIRVGDESGRLAILMRRAGELLEEDTMHRVETFMNLLEPAVLAAVSLGVGFLVIAILMPLSSIVAAF